MNLSNEGFLNPVAEKKYTDSGQLVKPCEAAEGDLLFCPDHDCVDPDRKLFLKRSPLGNLFFSHRPGCSHPIDPQTLLHKMAVKWFDGKNEFEMPLATVIGRRLQKKILLLDPTKTQLEFRQHQTVIPDVLVESRAGFRFAIEIVVTSDVSRDKSVLLHYLELPTICIDLYDFYKDNKELCRTDVDFISRKLDELLTDIHRKRWVRLPGPENQNEIVWEQKEKEPAPTVGCLVSLFFLFLVSLLFVRTLQ